MLLNKLTAISPVDGRYRNQTEKLADYFSEYALIRYRIRVEVEYFIALCELPLPELSGVEKSKFEALRALYLDFSEADALRVKEIEATTNHDVKAIEYILKEKMEALDRDLENNWAVVAEGIQTVLRRAGYPSPYEALKALTRTNAHITRESIAEFIESLDVAESVKQELRAITPQSYTGVFE